MDRYNRGWGSGLVGVIIFSGSLPATRVAVAEFSPLFVAAGRAVIAALLGGLCLLALRQEPPKRHDIVQLGVVAVGVVLGFPLLTGIALKQMTSAHSLVFIGLLPLSTAIFGVWRGGERPAPAFWLFSVAGAATVGGYALLGSSGKPGMGDLMMLAAIILCGLGYAEGASLSRRLGGWQVISWALLLSLPMTILIAFDAMPVSWHSIGWRAWAGFGYVSLFSMMLGFVFWYRGLALGGTAGVGQLQLLQPFFGLLLASLVLGEPVSGTMVASTCLVIACVAGARRFAA